MEKIKDILKLVKAKIEVHKEYKKTYNKQLAFDFSLFNFFNVGENKTSEILAYFLNPSESHSQGDVFLRDFVDHFYSEKIDLSEAKIICEEIIDNKRRIDIYIKLKDHIIAIENKIWAYDQKNQLRDYSLYLEKESKGNYLLLYLNPYGTNPSHSSISKKSKLSLEENNKFKVISYSHHIDKLISRWIGLCEADNVLYFLKQFKNHLKNSFYDNKLNMSSQLKELIYSNKEEVKALVNSYKIIENDTNAKLDNIWKVLENNHKQLKYNLLFLEKIKPFPHNKLRVFKYGLSKDKNKIWLQLVKEDIELSLNFYFEKNCDNRFKKMVKQYNLKNDFILSKEISENNIVDLFIEQVDLASTILYEYSKNI